MTNKLTAVAGVLASACAGTRETVAIVTGGELPAARPVWVIGVAGNAKLGAVVTAGEHVVYCEGRAAWPPEQDGKPVVIAGTLTTRTLPPPPVGPHRERSAGAEGAMSTLSPCAFPPEHDGGGLIEAERALFAALARRDRAALERLVAPELVLRIPGQPDADRAALLQGIAAAPGDILEVTGEQLRAHDAGDTGIVEGIQLAWVRIDGKVLEDRGAFVDVFAKRDGAWRVTFALNVPVSELPAR
ncbi:MAG TPA: nuclear transport factor 2 family protein [Kofleriaceae bacterium]|nr:nuclear transport factor 2 family protein [Kofleriaceae bacterium]